MSATTTTLKSLWDYFDAHRGHGVPNLWNALPCFAKGDIQGKLTPEVIHALLEHAPYRDEIGMRTTPPLITNFMAVLAGMFNPTSILDPMCGTGAMLQKVYDACTPKTADGVDIYTDSVEIAKQLLNNNLKVQLGNIFDQQLNLDNTYDLIVADPPIGVRISKERLDDSLQGLNLRDIGQYLALWACQRLSKEGTLAIVLSQNALQKDTFKQAIKDQGYRICASFHVPVGTRISTRLASQILVIQPGEQENIFVGQLSKNAQHQKRLLQNFRSHQSDNHPSLGRICKFEKFINFESLEAEHRLRQGVRRTSLKAHSFNDLIAGQSRHRFDDSSDLVPAASPATLFLPRDPFRFYADSNQMPERTKSYTCFKLDTEKVHSQYLLGWLNTDLGKTALQAAGLETVISRITPATLKRLTCYLPPIHEQREIIDALRKLECVRTEIQEIEACYWTGMETSEKLLFRAQTVNIEDCYEDWIESLPYPLASILWRHQVSCDDPRIRFRILLHFFEAMAEFLATVHLSAFVSHKPTWYIQQEKLLQKLKHHQLSFEMATFGTWKVVVESLSSLTRKMLQDPDQVSLTKHMYAIHNFQWLQTLCAPKIATILSNASVIRNTHGHGGAMGIGQAKEVEQELLSLVEQVRGVFGRGWLHYELIQGEKMELSDGSFKFHAPRIMGTRDQFARVECITTTPMNTGQLYLLEEKASQGLELLPFVRLMASSCYFYNRIADKGLRFVSYHFEREAEICDHFEDTAQAITHLTKLPTIIGMEVDA